MEDSDWPMWDYLYGDLKKPKDLIWELIQTWILKTDQYFFKEEPFFEPDAVWVDERRYRVMIHWLMRKHFPKAYYARMAYLNKYNGYNEEDCMRYYQLKLL